MNTAERTPLQEVASDHPPAAVAGGPSGSEARYWWRLVKAAALVLVGVTVHLWIDGPLPAVPGSLAPAETIADAGPSHDPPTRQPDIPRGPERVEALSALPLESVRPVATSGDANQLHRPRPGGAALPEGTGYRHVTTAPPSKGGILRTGGLPEVPDTELPALPSARQFTGWTGEAVALSPVAVPPTVPDVRNTAAAAPAPSASRVARALPVVPRREEESILQVLHDYETAVGRKDPAAAKAVWPALDDRALARAFNDLQSHSLALEDCGVTVANSNAAARARCQGVATYLPKVGRRKPISASHEYTFNLSKAGGDWQIESAAIR